MDEATLIHDVLQRAEVVRRLPVASLIPHHGQIEQLFTTVSTLHRSVSDETPTPADDSGSSNLSTRSVHRSRQVDAKSALQAACVTALRLRPLIRRHFGSENPDWLSTTGDPRLSHVLPILALQKSRISAQTDAQDRVLLACSCHSLAVDYEAYEENRGWRSKYQSLLRDLLHGQGLTVQRNGRHHQTFLADLSSSDVHRGRFDAGLRLGTKMRLIQACSENAGIGSALGLLLGYECHKLSRLPYREIPAVFALLRQADEDLVPITEFCNEFDTWWQNLSQRYHAQYTMSTMPSAPASMSEQSSASSPSFDEFSATGSESEQLNKHNSIIDAPRDIAGSVFSDDLLVASSNFEVHPMADLLGLNGDISAYNEWSSSLALS